MTEYRTYDLGPVPRPALVRFLREDGSSSAPYIVRGHLVAIPPGVAAIDITQMPVYPDDYPAGDEPGWGNDPGRNGRTGVPQDIRPGDGSVTRTEVRGPDRFRHAGPG
jgi:hypothetical protein